MQAFGNGFGPFLEHLADEDFLHAVSCSLSGMSAQKQTPCDTMQGAMAYEGRRQSPSL